MGTTTKSSTQATNSVRPGSGYGLHTVAVTFSAWGPQAKRVRASGGGGRGDAAYVAVTVGDCLTYSYDRDALRSHLRAWQEAAEVNRSLRLPEQPAREAAARQGGQDVALVCTVTGAQRFTATSAVEAGAPVLSVVIGAVTVRVHTTTALASYLAAWTEAQTLAGILDDPEPTVEPEPDQPRKRAGR